jgi:hypothetical protein
MQSRPRTSDVQVLPDPALRWLGAEYAKDCIRQGRKWYPATQAQFDALNNPADILLLGGAAGSLKTSTLLVDLIQERHYPKARSYFFRRTYRELEGADGAIDQAYRLFSQMGATYNAGNHTWKFASGFEFYFRHAQHEKDVYSYQGHGISAIAIDESTHWPMSMIRYLVTRNRSTDKGLKVRFRLGSNPGNVGHKDHQKMFFNGVCPHCEPHNAPPQNTLRWDAKWHDGVPLTDPDGYAISIAYILSYVREHDLLGARYIAALKMQSPATAKALLEGCWRIFEGQYYDVWDHSRMTVALQTIPVEWWWPHWTGTDYGFSGSAAASGEFTRSPEGVIYLLNEYPSGDVQGARREDARRFAQNHYKRLIEWKKDSIYEQPKRVDAMYLGRDSWAERGADHSLAQLMNEELEPHELEFTPVSDDRAGGAQLTYIKLANDEFKIARNCRNTIESLESRLHDEKEPMKVKKDPGSHLCDYHDMVLHGLYGYLESERKPDNERVKERMKKIIESTRGEHNEEMGLTSAILQHAKIKKEEEAADSEEQTYVGGSIRRRLQQKKE